MRLFSTLALIPLLAQVLAQERQGSAGSERFDYQSDVARLREIVIKSIYSNRDVFLRELISNANDAIEKWRVISLKESIATNEPLNITMKLLPNANKKGGRMIITDTGIGMTPDELTRNLGTLAKSGTSEFLKKAEDSKGKGDANLIGQFGLGFYSSFLVANDVYVASMPPPTKENPKPQQHVFYSSSEATSFDVYPDPRGNTLQRGTELTLILKEDAMEYLREKKVRDLIAKHSAFSTAYPIYLWATKTEEVPLTPEDEGYVAPEEKKEEAKEEKKEEAEKKESSEDDDEVIVEDEEEKPKEKEIIPQTKNVTYNVWDHLNNQPPLWMKDPKNVTDNEVNEFYRATFKDANNPVAWHIFKGDTGSGTSFRAMLFIPPELPKGFWVNPEPLTDQIRLFVKRVFITNDLGDNAMPKWCSWLRAIVDAEDLPLNVSRETLQGHRFMAQAKQVLIKRMMQVMAKVAAEEPYRYEQLMKAGYGPIFKLGAVESPKDQKKLVSLVRFTSNLRTAVSLDEYVEKRKKGQQQIFYMAGIGETPENLAKSVFVEQLAARGYEVLLLNEPMDEILFAQLHTWKEFKIQDVAKEGLEFGDEDEDPEAEKKRMEEERVRFEPLMKYITDQSKEIVGGVIISNRLVTSPCAVVANNFGYSGNMQKLVQAQHAKEDKHQGIIQEWAKKQRVLEINPKSPLIEGLLTKVKELNDVAEGEEKDADLDAEMKEIVAILLDGALVRSGFEVADNNVFFNRIDRVLRRSLGVSESAKGEAKVKPAPPEVETPKEETSKEKTKKKLPDLDAPEFLNDMPNILEGDEAPFDPTKAVDIDVADGVEGKVGYVPGEDEQEEGKPKVGGDDWDKESSENLEKLLKMHDEL